MTNKQQVIEYLENNKEEVRQIVSELNSWNGSLEHLEVHHNDEDFFSTFFDGRVMEAVRAISFGEYEFNDDYVRFNGYGNLETLSEYDYERELADSASEIADILIDEYQNISVDDELLEILEEEEEDEE